VKSLGSLTRPQFQLFAHELQSKSRPAPADRWKMPAKYWIVLLELRFTSRGSTWIARDQFLDKTNGRR
jgi:hypothetical protein